MNAAPKYLIYMILLVLTSRASQEPQDTAWPSTADQQKAEQRLRLVIPGQTMAETSGILERSGWRPHPSRTKEEIFADISTNVFHHVKSLRSNPKAQQEILQLVPDATSYTYIQFQGYPTTREWIFVFYASQDDSPENMRSFYATIVPWGCY